jgi:hypothetical protein
MVRPSHRPLNGIPPQLITQLTGLTSAMLVDESNPDFIELDSIPPGGESAGLYIKDKTGSFIKINIPRNCLAFQIGEAAQVSSKGILVATPHLVRGVESESIARNTFAVFMQVYIARSNG